MDNIAEGRDKTARRAHGPQPEKSMALAGVEFVSGVYPGRRFRRLIGRRLTSRHGELMCADRARMPQNREGSLAVQVIQDI
jgi:hypothetical protein